LSIVKTLDGPRVRVVMQEYSPNELQYSKQQIYEYNHRKLKKQKQNTKIDVWIIG